MPGERYLVAGLGNIGAEYAETRHNMGFIVLDAWSEASNAVFSTDRYGDVCSVKVRGREFLLLKPSTYMNLSGNAVRYWLGKMNIPAERLIVVCDDINLPFGVMRLRGSGSDGGHNGLKNIIELTGTSSFARLRIGVGHDFSTGGQIDYVLGHLDDNQMEKIPALCEKAREGITKWAFEGLQAAMNFTNAKETEPCNK